jgi:tetratricopeptide (TPR) repeat protein
MGNLAVAISDSSAAIRCDPRVKNAHYYRASLYLRMGNFDAALSGLNEAIRWNSTSAYEYQSRARVDAELGKLNLARTTRALPDQFTARFWQNLSR